jgi:hypothetical protein
MLAIKVEITRFLDDHQPGFVECSLIDAHGRKHLFIDKVPVVALEDLDAHSIYPRDGVIGCEVVNGPDDSAREILTVSTELPWGIESAEGLLVFEVRREQLTEISNDGDKDRREAV